VPPYAVNLIEVLKNGLDALAAFGDLRSLPQLASRKESACRIKTKDENADV
jgi:hypothetical protein